MKFLPGASSDRAGQETPRGGWGRQMLPLQGDRTQHSPKSPPKGAGSSLHPSFFAHFRPFLTVPLHRFLFFDPNHTGAAQLCSSRTVPRHTKRARWEQGGLQHGKLPFCPYHTRLEGSAPTNPSPCVPPQCLRSNRHS